MLYIELMLLGIAAVLLLSRRRIAEQEIGRLIERGGLPTDPELVAAGRRWYIRRQVVLVSGVVVGALVGGAIVLVLRRGWHISLASGPDNRLLTWIVAVAVAAGGLASLGHSYQTVRAARADGPRTATLRPRQISDYLTPIELWIQYGALLLPVAAALMGVVVLGSERPGPGWVLIGSGLAAVPLWALGILLQRKVLEINQPSRSAAELRWQEALRATTLRDLASAGLTVCWLLGAAIPMSFQWSTDAPRYFDDLASGLYLVAVALLCVSGTVGRSERALRRVQRVAG